MIGPMPGFDGRLEQSVAGDWTMALGGDSRTWTTYLDKAWMRRTIASSPRQGRKGNFMVLKLSHVAATAALLVLSTSAVEARHAKVHVHHHYARGGTPGPRAPSTSPRYGYEQSPADSTYQGPGADVYRQTILSAHAPGTALELDPDAKETATGGPAGGLPNNGNGP